MRNFRDIEDAVAAMGAGRPLYMFSPRRLAMTARAFTSAFPGDVLYAVKCNPDPLVIATLADAGMNGFDVASVVEMKLVSRYAPRAECHFMHPVKAPEDIAMAVSDFGVTSLALDSFDELEKILANARSRAPLTLYVRLDVPFSGSLIDLSRKFGAAREEAVGLLRAVAASGNRPGLTFHVGSQSIGSEAYLAMLDLADRIAGEAGAGLAAIDIGGGFPAAYTGVEEDFGNIASRVAARIEKLGLGYLRLACEPGRALVAESVAIATRIEAVRGGFLYLNDGLYGNLAEVKFLGSRIPMAIFRNGRHLMECEMAAFGLYGPTCDSADVLQGPFRLPASAKAGDVLVLGMMGAYSNACRTSFNGFGDTQTVGVEDLSLPPSRFRVREGELGAVA